MKFNLEYFKKLNHKEKFIYCKENFYLLGRGSSRKVFQIDDERCIKLALNNAGVAQNSVEIELSEDGYFRTSLFFAQILEASSDNFWIIMELAKPCTHYDFTKIYSKSFSFRNFIYYLNMFFDYDEIDREDLIRADRDYLLLGRNENEKQKVLYNFERILEAAEGIYEMSEKFDISQGDLVGEPNYGIINNKYGKRIVVIDYGLNPEVYENYYKH